MCVRWVSQRLRQCSPASFPLSSHGQQHSDASAVVITLAQRPTYRYQTIGPAHHIQTYCGNCSAGLDSSASDIYHGHRDSLVHCSSSQGWHSNESSEYMGPFVQSHYRHYSSNGLWHQAHKVYVHVATGTVDVVSCCTYSQLWIPIHSEASHCWTFLFASVPP